MNPLEKWKEEFERKRDYIVMKEKLYDKSPEEIAEFFTYKNLKEKYPDFCPLFKTGEKCHDLPEDELNCFFCACPYYDTLYEKDGEYGRCEINSKYGYRNKYGYWDCSNCLLPHRKKFVIHYLKKNGRWFFYHWEYLKDIIELMDEIIGGKFEGIMDDDDIEEAKYFREHPEEYVVTKRGEKFAKTYFMALLKWEAKKRKEKKDEKQDGTFYFD